RLRLQLVAGEMLGPERDRVAEIRLEVGDGLAGNAVDEVEREVVEAGLAQVRERVPHVLGLRAALERFEQANELRESGERRSPAAEEDGLDVAGEHGALALELAQERVDVGGVLL